MLIMAMQKIVPSRTDDKATGTLPTTHFSQDISPPSSPYPGRRPPLSTLLESELRFACTGVLQNTKLSHIIAPDEPSRGPKPQLDYAAIKKSAVKSPDNTTQRDPSSRRPVPGSLDVAEHDAPASANKYRYPYKPDTALEDLFPAGDSTHESIQAGINLPVAVQEPEKHKRTKSSRSLGQTVTANGEDRLRDAKRTGSRETSGSTPQTDVTEYPWSLSTAPTSAGVTPARASKRASAHIQAEQEPTTSKNDISAIECMRNDLDKRRKQQAPSHSRQPSHTEFPDTLPPSRPRSRARSITRSIKEYIRPNTAGNASRDPSRPPSRTASRASHRTGTSERERSPSTRGGWRSWGLSRKDEVNGDLSRSSSRGRSENRKGNSSKSRVNLNRELPPLPSLQTWKQAESAEKSNHVANLVSPTLRPKNSMQQDSLGRPRASTAVSEKEEIVAARLGTPVAKAKPEVYQPSRPPKSTSKGNVLAVSPAMAIARTTDPDREARNRDRDFGLEDLVPTNTRETWTHQPSTSTNSSRHPQISVNARNAPVTQTSYDHNSSIHGRHRSVNFSRIASPGEPPVGTRELASSAPSFSQHRNYDKADIPPALNSNTNNRLDTKYRYEAEINSFSPPPVPPKDDRKGWWPIKSKQKKPATWMDQLEKLGVKDGVLVDDEVAGSPVIRY